MDMLKDRLAHAVDGGNDFITIKLQTTHCPEYVATLASAAKSLHWRIVTVWAAKMYDTVGDSAEVTHALLEYVAP